MLIDGESELELIIFGYIFFGLPLLIVSVISEVFLLKIKELNKVNKFIYSSIWSISGALLLVLPIHYGTTDKGLHLETIFYGITAGIIVSYILIHHVNAQSKYLIEINRIKELH